jgi:hypothetical protein
MLQPSTGFHVVSVHSIVDCVAMLFLRVRIVESYHFQSSEPQGQEPVPLVAEKLIVGDGPALVRSSAAPLLRRADAAHPAVLTGHEWSEAHYRPKLLDGVVILHLTLARELDQGGFDSVEAFKDELLFGHASPARVPSE